jgi:hypothetical protein
MEKEAIKLELSAFPMWKVLDTQTSECYLYQGEAPVLNAGRKIFNDCKEIQVNGFYFGLSSFIEDGSSFTILNPYKLTQPKTPKRSYGFGAYDPTTNELFMFFSGKATTNERSMAIKVYNSLVNYCKTNHLTLKPFSIKL